MVYKCGKDARFFRLFYFSLVFYIFGGIFNITIIPLALVGYKMIIANSYPTCACKIIVNYRAEVQY